MSAWLVTDFVLVGIAVLLFTAALHDWVVRNARRFPTLVYGGREVSRGSARFAWALLLLLGALLGHVSPYVLTSSSSTWAASSASAARVLEAEGVGSAAITYESSRGIYLNHEVRLTGEWLTETRQVRIPILFLLGIAGYFLLVVRWSAAESSHDPPGT